jgi:hypothetical protein
MSNQIHIELTESQFKLLKLYVHLGDMVKDQLEEKTHSESMAHMELYQVLDKAAYDAKLKSSGKQDGFYYYGVEIEEEMLDIMETYDTYVESGDKARDLEALEKQLREEGLF